MFEPYLVIWLKPENLSIEYEVTLFIPMMSFSSIASIIYDVQSFPMDTYLLLKLLLTAVNCSFC